MSPESQSATVERPLAMRDQARPRSSTQSVVGWLFTAALAATAPAMLVLPRNARLERGALWGVVLLVGMAGWGELVARLTLPRCKTDLGLRLAWGAAALLLASGLLGLVALATSPVLLALVLGGVALSVAAGVTERETLGARLLAWCRLWSPSVLLAFLALAVLVGVHLVGGAAGSYLNGNDDQAAYLIFPQKILGSGTLIDPFSVRRITAYGGHSFLQALALIGASSPLQAPILDMGVSLVIVFALILGAGSDSSAGARNLLVLAALIVVTAPNIRLNSGSEMSGGFVFLALFRTAASASLLGRPSSRGALLGLLAAVACTLRQSFLVPVTVFMVVLYLPAARAALFTSGNARRAHLRPIVVAAGTLLLALVPWALMSYRSCRTFLFPLVTGNYRPDYVAFTTHSSFVDRVKLFWENVVYCHPIRSIPFFILAGLLVPGRRTNGALPALLWAAFIGFVTVVYSLPMSDAPNIARYYFGFSVASVIAVLLSVFSRSWQPPRGGIRMRVVIPAIVAIAASVTQVEAVRKSIKGDYAYLAKTILAARARPSTLDDRGAHYRELQATIPAGASMLVMLDDASWFDFRRNRIDLVDLPGAVSPPPGMPLDDDEKLVSYLRGLGYRYLAFVRSTASTALYRRDAWIKHLNSPTTPEIWRRSAPFYLNTFDRFDALAQSRVHLYDDGAMMALDLAALQKHEDKHHAEK